MYYTVRVLHKHEEPPMGKGEGGSMEDEGKLI
jgi:hypothetical protein